MSMSDGVYDEDERLPWLETVEEDYSEGPSIARIVVLVLLGLALLAAAIFGIFLYQKGRGTADGNGELIQAQEGDYKVKPNEPGGMKVEGEGDTVFAASQGAVTNGSIDASAVPEAPVSGRTVAIPKPQATKGAPVVAAPVPKTSAQTLGERAAASSTKQAPKVATAGSGGALVQLGAFPSSASAQGEWKRLASRFGYLSPLGHSVEQAVVNGRTVFRLRVNAGSHGQATDICNRLKVAGERCFVA